MRKFLLVLVMMTICSNAFASHTETLLNEGEQQGNLDSITLEQGELTDDDI